MSTTKNLLFDLIDAFTPSEREAAQQWLACPLHNQRQELVRLFAHLSEQVDLGIYPRPERAFTAATSRQAFTKARWAKLQHGLLRVLEAFIAFRHYQRSEEQQRLSLLWAYRERDLESHLLTRINRYRGVKTKLQNPASREKFWYDYEVERLQNSLSTANQRRVTNPVLAQEEYLQRAIIASKLRQACESLAYLRLFKTDYQIPLLKEVIGEARKYTDDPGIWLYYLAVMLYRPSTTDLNEVFDQLKEGILQHIEAFPLREQRNLLLLAINHCLQQSNAGQENYYAESLELYQLGIHKKVLYERGQLGIFTFNNIIAIAIRQGEMEWAANFLEQNVRRLPAAYRPELESLNRARLAFKQKDYDATLGYLRTADYRDFIHHMSARVMQLKIYFERDNFNLLTSHIRATKSLIRRKRNLSYHQTNYLNVFMLAEKLLRLPPGNKAVKEQLREKIKTTEPCTEKEWLLAQLNY
ncbi:MAG: hypothetical protein AAF828_03570 [Bacteroidota bacterium]